jgi:hypothetical protein
MNIIEQLILAACADHVASYHGFVAADEAMGLGSECVFEHRTPNSVLDATWLLNAYDAVITEHGFRFKTEEELLEDEQEDTYFMLMLEGS